MTSQKDIDTLIVGKNILSFLVGEYLVSNGKSALIVDDLRVNYGEVFTGYIGHIEKSFLVMWGNQFKVTNLINISDFLDPVELTFSVEKTLVKLGRTPLENLQELYRKCPQMFKSCDFNPWSFNSDEEREHFNLQFLRFVDEASKILYQNDKFTINNLFMNAPSFLRELYLSFESSAEDHFVDAFLFSARGFFQNKLSFEHNEFETLHLIISLISPLYRVNQTDLLDSFTERFAKVGGNIQKTKLRDVQYEKKRPWAVELESYEGVVCPDKIALFGGDCHGLNLKLKPSKESYRAVCLEWKFEEDISSIIPEGLLVFSSYSKIGTNRPWWLIDIVDNKTLNFKIFTHNLNGLKASFLEDEIVKFLEKEVFKLYPSLSSLFYFQKIWLGNEIFLRANHDKRSSNEKVKVCLSSQSHKDELVKDTFYFGPYKESSLGFISSMIEVKDFISKYC